MRGRGPSALPPRTRSGSRWASWQTRCAGVRNRCLAVRHVLPNLLSALLLSACVQAFAGPAAVQDATGATVTLAAPARRIVSLAPHATELLFAAGAGDRIVGVLAPADWPPEAQRLVQVGTASGL